MKPPKPLSLPNESIQKVKKAVSQHRRRSPPIFGRFYWKIFFRCVSIHSVLTLLPRCSLAEIIPEPNPLMIPRLVEMLTAIAYASLVLERLREKHYHEVSGASESGKFHLLSNRKRIAVQNHD